VPSARSCKWNQSRHIMSALVTKSCNLSCQFLSFVQIHIIHVNSCHFMPFVQIHVSHSLQSRRTLYAPKCSPPKGPRRFKLKKNRIILARRTLSEEDNANAQVSALLFGCLSYGKTPRSYSIALICGCCRAIVIYCIYSYILHRPKVGLYWLNIFVPSLVPIW
jgi:hypothetical protein